MRVSKPLAWLLVVSVMFTSGLLRQFHAGTPNSPYVPTLVGSMLFAAIFFLLLVSAREWRLGGAPGKGVRIGSLTPLMLMLLIEKWVSLGLYNPLFYAVSPLRATEAELDAEYRAFAGAGLLLVCLLVGWFSRPAASVTMRRADPRRWPSAAISAAAVLGLTYGLLALLSTGLGGELRLYRPRADSLWWWTIGGQALLSFAEEVYYRGLILAELYRLGPRLGARRAARRWFALFGSAAVFGMEHLTVSNDWQQMARQLVFTVSLGVLFGMLVLITDNLHFVAAVHAWINWLLLGSAPRFVDPGGNPALPSGTYIALALILAFCVAVVLARRGKSRLNRHGAEVPSRQEHSGSVPGSRPDG